MLSWLLVLLADATITLLLRLAAGEPVTQAHHRHFYQRAVDSGIGVHAIVGRVFLTNIALVVLATLSVRTSSRTVQAGALAADSVSVGLLLFHFTRGKQ